MTTHDWICGVALSPEGCGEVLRFWLAQVLRDSYFWASQVKAAAVTTTARGVTSKMLLLGTAADQVCGRALAC